MPVVRMCCQFCAEGPMTSTDLMYHARTCAKNPRNGAGRDSRPSDARKVRKADKKAKKWPPGTT